MKLLSELLYKVRLEEVVGSTHIAIEHITSDSRSVKPLSLFVAVKGTRFDGHNYIDQAIEGGAEAILCEALPEQPYTGVTFIKVASTGEAFGVVAENFYDNPSEKLKVVAVTGTNGKTTTATLLFDLFKALGYPVGLLSTVENRINKFIIPATHTTPDAVSMRKMMDQMVREGCAFCFMEASSHAIDQFRIAGIKFEGAVFTNLTPEHLDYHLNMENYLQVKKRLFDGLSPGAFALTNADDFSSEEMISSTSARIKTYGLGGQFDYRVQILENDSDGLRLNLNGTAFHTRMVGRFNAYNLLAAFGVAMELGQNKDEVLPLLSALMPAEGRFVVIKSKSGVTAIVDYAHTPDALENVLKTIGEIRTGNEQVITILGCGGDRDRTKRPIMARTAADFSDRVILTSDNPRSESPEAIIDEMKNGLDPIGLRKTIALTDRKEAIRLSVSVAKSGDIILLAGKGHEKYQEIQGVKFPFDDFVIMSETLNQSGC